MIRFAVDHPVATWMLFAALMVTGVYALPKLNIEAMPETELPELSIVTSWNGASPSAIQRSVTLPIEEAVAGCHGVEDLDSQSRHGQSTVTAKFKRGTNMEFARLELSERLGSVRRNLPAQAGQPFIRPFVPEELRTEEFFSVSLISPLSMNDLRDRAETWIVPRFLAIPGVADAELRGGARPLIKVLLDLELLERYGLTADGIAERLDELDDITPAGPVRRSGRELTVTVQDSVSLAALENTVLRTIGGQPVLLKHVARVQPDFEDIAYYSRIGGENVITLLITKRSGQNSIAVSRHLRGELPQIETEAPFPVTFEIDQDEGADLEDKLQELVIRSLVILGLLFVMLAFALKQVRLTAIVVFSIVLAIVICLSMFYFFGVSVNFITISGLTVCFGMLLDNSILVLDAIHRRLTGSYRGDARQALIRGTREVAFPIMATTLTTVVAFLSFIFMTDRLSLFYVPLAISVGIAMLASIFVAFCWIPVALRSTAEHELRVKRGLPVAPPLVGWPLFRRLALAVVLLAAASFGGLWWWKGGPVAVGFWREFALAEGLLLLAGAYASFRAAWGRYALPIVLAGFATAAYVKFGHLLGGGFLRQPGMAVKMLATIGAVVVAAGLLRIALRAPAGGGEGAPRTGDEFALDGWPMLWRWALGILATSGLIFGALWIWKGSFRALDFAPWLGGAAGLLILVGIFVAYVDRLTRLHVRFWLYPLVLVLGLFTGTFFVFKDKVRTGGFWRPQPTEQIIVFLERPVGTDVKLSSETIKLFEDEVLPVPEGVHMRSGAAGNRAWMFLEFDEDMLKTAYPEMFRNQVIILAEELGGMFIWINGFGDPYMKGGRGGGQSNSTVRLTGYNSKELKQISDGVLARLDRNRRVRNARLTSGDRFSRDNTDETVVMLDRQALASHRLSMAEVMGHIRRLLGVENPWHMVLDGEDQRLMLTFDDSESIEYDQVLGRTMTTSRGQKVQLGRLISIESRPEISSINRHDQKYSQQVNWEYIGTDRMRRQFIKEIVAGIELPYGYTAEDMSGEQITEEEEEELKNTLWLTLIFIFMALAAMFESFALPLLVLLAIPMALVGVGGIFWGTGAEFDSSAKIGLILMFGIVVNNAILLINRFRLQVREQLEAEGVPTGDDEGEVPFKRRLGGFDLWRLPGEARQRILRTAIIDGTRIQMRSILLTSGTTIAGLLPLLYKKDATAGKDIWENLALSSIGGLGSSTVLILMGMPALYWIFTRWGWGFARLGRWLKRRSGKAATATRETGLAE